MKNINTSNSSDSVSVFVINNPISLFYLITDVAEDIDEIWIENGTCPAIDNNIEAITQFIDSRFNTVVKVLAVSDIFKINSVKLASKHDFYRRMAKQVNSYVDKHAVGRVICSSTSAFRLAAVRRRVIFDHGVGDYFKNRFSLFKERLKFNLFAKDIFSRRTVYASLLPLKHRRHVAIKANFDTPENYLGMEALGNRGLKVLMLVDPKIAVNEQLLRVSKVEEFKGASVLLKFHHFHWERQCEEYLNISSRYMNDNIRYTVLDNEKQWIPAEALCMDKSSEVILAGFDSSTVWHMYLYYPDRVKVLMKEGEISAQFEMSGASLKRLTDELGFSPYSQ